MREIQRASNKTIQNNTALIYEIWQMTFFLKQSPIQMPQIKGASNKNIQNNTALVYEIWKCMHLNESKNLHYIDWYATKLK